MTIGPVRAAAGPRYCHQMPARSLYEIMMLHPTATTEVINAVYRVLAKQYHPDHAGPESAERMAQLNEAYAVLRNPARRAAYDARRSAAHPPSSSATPPPGYPADGERPTRASRPSGGPWRPCSVRGSPC